MININQIYKQLLENIIRADYGEELEKEFDKIRKETAREILKDILEFAYISLKNFGRIEEVGFDAMCGEIAKKFGVEVEEEG